MTETLTAASPREREEDTMAAIVLGPNGGETQASLRWFTERWQVRHVDGTVSHLTDQWPDGFDSGDHRIGAACGTNCQVWRASLEEDPRVAVMLGLGEVVGALYLCPNLRVAMGLIREFLPILQFETQFMVMDEINEHLAGVCAGVGARDTCLVCQLIAGRQR